MRSSRLRRVIRFRPLAIPVLALLGLLGLPRAVSSQQSTLTEEERVTALDVFVEVGGAADSTSKVPKLPRGLDADDFRVSLQGEALPVIGFLDPRAGTPAESEPWTIVVYFDVAVAERDSVRWAAAELAERVGDLVGHGTVEIVVAQETAVRVLAPTRDRELVEDQLAGLAFKPRGVHEVIEFRADVLNATRELPEETASSEWAREVVEAEAALVDRRLDEMLLYLVDRENQDSKRALIWVTDGFDLEPSRFYRAQGLAAAPDEATVSSRAEGLAATLAGYGWVTFAFAPPEPGPGLVHGWRLGKWLYRPRMPTGLVGGKLVREERRDPKRAESYLEIGTAHLGRAEPESAEAAFDKALYHFAGDPRTSKRQAEAKAGLGKALEAQDRGREARQAFRHAIALDAGLAALYPQVQARLLDPAAALERMANETAGRRVEDSEAVSEALESLGRRARLTYQVSGAPRGELGTLDVRLAESGQRLRYPRWARSGDPETVAAARARRSIRGEHAEGMFAVTASLEGDSGPRPELRVRVARPAAPTDSGDRGRLRVTIAFGRPEGVLDVRHETLELSAAQKPEEWEYHVELEAIDAEDFVAVVVQDIESGEWGAALVD